MRSVINTIAHHFQGRSDEQHRVALRHSASTVSLGRRYSTVDRRPDLTHQERILKRELTASMTKTIRINERQLFSLENEADELTKHNSDLTAHITQLTVALEAQWLQRGDKVAKTIATLFEKFKALDDDLTAKYTKARSTFDTYLQCVMPNKKDWDWNALRQRIGANHAYLFGIATETRKYYDIYSRGYSIKRYFTQIERLHQTFGDAFPAAVKAVVQKIKEEAWQGPLPDPQHGESSEIVPFYPNNLEMREHDEGYNVLYETIQEQIATKKDLQRSNLQLQEENVRLDKKAEHLKGIETQFVQHFRRELCKGVNGVGFHDAAQTIIKTCESDAEKHAKDFAALEPWMQENSNLGACYTTGLQLTQQISLAVKEIDRLFSEIEQGCPEPEPTT